MSAPTVTDFEGTVTNPRDVERFGASYPPLGILSLAAVLEEKNIAHEILDPNRLFCEWVARGRERSGDKFFPSALNELLSHDADVYGFGTISSSYPLTVRLAREVKRARPHAAIVFGGPQASAVDVETLETFPFVDAVVRGEAEEILPQLLGALGGSQELETVAGTTIRRNGNVARTTEPAALPDLDRLPTPAFHRWPGMKKCRTIPVEVGRGCPFACTFCSTSRFFHRRFRLKTPARVIEQMRALQEEYGMERFDLVHDIFTAVRRQAVEYCQAFLASGHRFAWTCSARTDSVDEELLELMANAGCAGIFFGIETGSARMQHEIAKDLDLDRAAAAIRSAGRHGTRTTISLITGFPGETREDLRCSIEFLMDSVCHDHVDPQFHLLAPLAGTAIREEFRGRLKWDGIYSDMAFQGWHQDPADRALILRHPDIFPNFYAVPTVDLDRCYLMELRDFLMYGVARFRWLMVALDRHSGLMAVFNGWRPWRNQHRPQARANGEYYASEGFRDDFLEFLASQYPAGDDPELLAVSTLLAYESQLGCAHRSGTEPQPALPTGPCDSASASGMESVPRVAPGVVLVRLGADFERIIDCLRNKRSCRDVPRRPVVVADRRLPGGRVEIHQLSPLSALLIGLCDGVRTVRDIAARFPSLGEGLGDLPPEPACCFALNELVERGMLTFSQPAKSGLFGRTRPDGDVDFLADVEPAARSSTLPASSGMSDSQKR